MKQQIMAVHDMAARAYCKPFFVPHLQMGVRTFTDACNSPQSEVSKHPADYRLYHLGEYDDETGLIFVLPFPLQIGHGPEFVNGVNNNV